MQVPESRLLPSGFTLGGTDAGNYTLTQPSATGTITDAGVIISGVTASDKVYNGTTSATINTTAAVIIGILPGDAVTLNSAGATGVFYNKNSRNRQNSNYHRFCIFRSRCCKL